MYCWGNDAKGGECSIGNIVNIFPNYNSFAGLKADGTVQSWGSYYVVEGGTSVPNVKEVFSQYGAFAAIRKDGKVKAWGCGTQVDS